MAPLIASGQHNKEEDVTLNTIIHQDGEANGAIQFNPALLFIFIGFLIAFVIHTIIRYTRRRRQRGNESLITPTIVFTNDTGATIRQPDNVVYSEEDIQLAREARNLQGNAVPSRSVLKKARRARLLMEQLPKHKYVAEPQSDDEDEQCSVCPICLDDLHVRDVTKGACGHVMHHDCLQFWLVRDRGLTCPVCRVRIQGPNQSNNNSSTPAEDNNGKEEKSDHDHRHHSFHSSNSLANSPIAAANASHSNSPSNIANDQLAQAPPAPTQVEV